MLEKNSQWFQLLELKESFPNIETIGYIEKNFD
jgi:hypothetical protein